MRQCTRPSKAMLPGLSSSGVGVKHGHLDDSRLVNLCTALGPSILRVGGASQDEVTYDFGVSPQEGTFGPSDIDKVFRFANATGWHIVWGLSYMRRRT